MRYLVDSSAWIEYFEGSEKGEKIDKILRETKVYTISLIISEIVSKFKRNDNDFNQAFRIINSNSIFFNLTPDIAREAGLLHAEKRKKFKNFGLNDAIILVAAKKIGAKIITCDFHFKDFKEVIYL